MTGQFAALPLRRDSYLAGGSINVHDSCLHTQLRSIYIDIHIVTIDEGKETCDKDENFLFFEHQYLA